MLESYEPRCVRCSLDTGLSSIAPTFGDLLASEIGVETVGALVLPCSVRLEDKERCVEESLVEDDLGERSARGFEADMERGLLGRVLSDR